MARSPQPSVLITGFGPFPGVPANATGRIVPQLVASARRRFPAVSFATAILPTEWAAAPAVLGRHLVRTRPHVALHFGVSREARGFVIETLGRNHCRDSIDAAGLRPRSGCINPGGAETHAVSLPVEAIVERLAAAGHPVRLSDDAGSYLCNAILYHSLCHAAAAAPQRMTGFIHVPADLDGPEAGLTLSGAIAGGLEILAACLDAPRAAVRPRPGSC